MVPKLIICIGVIFVFSPYIVSATTGSCECGRLGTIPKIDCYTGQVDQTACSSVLNKFNKPWIDGGKSGSIDHYLMCTYKADDDCNGSWKTSGGAVIAPTVACGSINCEGLAPKCIDKKCYTQINESCSAHTDCAKFGGGSSVNYYLCHTDKKCYLGGDALTKYNTQGDDWIKIYNEIKPPKINISIPGLDFASLSSTLDSEGYIHIPYLGQYLTAVYKFAMVAVSIVAVIMLIVIGAGAIVSGGGDKKVEGIKKMGKVFLGLAIAWGSYAILYNINPDLVEFKALKVQYVIPKEMPDFPSLWEDLDSSSSDLAVLTDPNFHHSTIPDKYVITNDLIKKIATANKIDVCAVWTIIKKESGGNGLAVGHDENYNHNKRGTRCPNIGSRARFLVSGKKLNGGALFSPIAGCLKGQPCSNPYDPCTMNETKIFNNDTFNPKNPPDYGLDWRFSHGFGIGQMTIVPYKSYCRKINGPNGPEWARNVGGKWYTVTDLLNPDKAVEATMVLIKYYWDKSKGDLRQFFASYTGGPSGISRAMTHYQTCPFK